MSRSAPPARTLPLERDLVATGAVTAYSLAVAFGFARVFSGWAFFADLAALVVIGHASSFALRRARVPGIVAIPGVAALLLWTIAMYQYRPTTTWWIPGRATWRQLRVDLGLVRDQFQTAVAPVIYDVGWSALAGLAIVLVVVMADAFAFRAEARGETLVPGGVLFIFIAALGSPRLRIGSTMVLIVAGVLAVAALRHLHDRSRRVELATGRRGSAWVPAAVATGAAVAVLAGVIGPRIPGAQAEPWYETRGRGGGVTQLDNPLVDIRSRLVNQGNVELFRVNADAGRYWRVTTLPDFDGRTFRLPSRPLTDLSEVDVPDSGVTIRQQVHILSLTGRMVPAAADPVRITPSVPYNAETGMLSSETEFGPGDLYVIHSIEPNPTADQLRAASTANPPDDMFLALPGELPSLVVQTAQEVTAGASTDYDRLLALQTYFREFEYSVEVQPGHGSNAIEAFLRIRTGYCEQFAATMAVMARVLGIPSRVAVGYTPGLQRPDGWYSVLGKNAHAWPEFWFEGIGWIPLEPTPQRGNPGATEITGVEPQQENEPADPGEDVPPDQATLPPTPTTLFQPSGGAPTTVARERIPDRANTTPSSQIPESGTTFPWIPIGLVALIVAGAAFPALARRWHARSIRGRPVPERIDDAWRRARRSAVRAGIDGSPAMTSSEWAQATSAQLPVAARPMASLARLVDEADYARPGSTVAVEEHAGQLECELWATQVERISNDSLTPRGRVVSYFSDWRA